MDKSRWPQGPWMTEDDEVIWDDPDTGLPCLMVRVEGIGSWCGYVGVPPGHPLHGKHYDDLVNIAVHGGLTFSGDRHGWDVPRDYWYFGFDCAHAGDISGMAHQHLLPEYLRERFSRYGVYRDEEWVEREVTKLAQLLKQEGARQ